MEKLLKEIGRKLSKFHIGSFRVGSSWFGSVFQVTKSGNSNCCDLWGYCRKSFQVLFFTHFQSSFYLRAKKGKKLARGCVLQPRLWMKLGPALPFFAVVLPPCSWHGGRDWEGGRVSKQSKIRPAAVRPLRSPSSLGLGDVR